MVHLKHNEIKRLSINRLPPSAEQGRQQAGSILVEASSIAQSVHLANTTHLIAEPVSRKERAELNEFLRPKEEVQLLNWAQTQHIFKSKLDLQLEFNRKPDAQGNEQLVFVSDDGSYVTKINDGAYHGTWLEFFDRLALHNFLFPETAYKFTGFTIRIGFHGEDRFACILQQPFIQTDKGAGFELVKNDMNLRGFRHLKGNDFYNPEMGLIVEDLHDENVFEGKESLIYIDPVIYLETVEMNLDKKNVFRTF